ncbi:hypothetical protein B0H14DRAFT_2612897 [Mycena olivaceomarginata]|nr:hypothetical protein B0H14DRAFT_2612897 [Mycena olivaceomarginata]
MKGFCSWEKHIKTDQHKGLKVRRLMFRTHPYSQAALHQLEAPGPGTIRPTFQSLSANEFPILGPVSTDQSNKDLPGSTIFATGASNNNDNGTMSLPVPVNTPVSNSGSEVAENSMLVFGSAGGAENLGT